MVLVKYFLLKNIFIIEQYYRLSQIVNGLLCAFNSSELAITELPLEKVETTSSYQSDWANAFNAIHSVAVGTISIVFILGYIIIL